MDANAGGHSAVNALTPSCEACGTQLGATAKYCSECGAPAAHGTPCAEYKQVTVLFADVVHSMDLAAAVGAERLRDIMAELVVAASAVVKRYGGTVDKFTGYVILTGLGARVVFAEQAVRACLAGLGVQESARRLAVDVRRRDGVDLELRIGLNSGQVIAGEIGSGTLGYTAIGEQVGIAQRMESIAPPGGVMLSHSTARLVEHAAVLDEEEMVHVKGRRDPVPACRLRTIRGAHGRLHRQESTLVGRQREVAVLAAALDGAIGGTGGVVQIVGVAGVGKTRLVREAAEMACRRGFEVVAAFCESHARELPFYAGAGLLRGLFGIAGAESAAARDRIRDLLPSADAEDLLLLDDLLGVGGAGAPSVDIDPDARRRRLIRLVNSAVLTRTPPTLYVIEDAHWIDDASEWMLECLFSILAQTNSLALLTYRPEYGGALARTPDSLTLAVPPLDESDTAVLTREMLGADPSVTRLGAQVAERAAGNPFFAEEMVRDLEERRLLEGARGAYVCRVECGEVSVPATVQATIAARIDRLGTAEKRTLNAAAVIGSRFEADLLARVAAPTAFAALVDAELLESVAAFQYAFRHPLIRAVAYESQLKSDRSLLHRRVAEAIQQRDPSTLEENAALIATHLGGAGDLRDAFGWYMRAGAWLTNRDIAAARGMWSRACDVADRLPDDEPDRTSMGIAPRMLLCGYLWCVAGAGVAESGLDELRERCGATGDQVSLVMGMSGVLVSMTLNHQLDEFRRLAKDYLALLESIGDSTLMVGLLNIVTHGAFELGESMETLRLAEQVIALADGDAVLGSFFFESPLAWAIALRGLARCSLGQVGWRDDLRVALAMARTAGGMTQAAVVTYGYGVALLNGVLLADSVVMEHTTEALRSAERSGNEVSLAWTRVIHGVASVRMHGGHDERGMELIAQGRRQAVDHGDLLVTATADIQLAECRALSGDTAGAIDLAAAMVEHLSDRGKMSCSGPATRVLVEALLRRGSRQDLHDAQAAIDGLAARKTDAGFVFNELPLLRMRALLARARGDLAGYRDYREGYRTMATALDFEGHMAMAQAMP